MIGAAAGDLGEFGVAWQRMRDRVGGLLRQLERGGMAWSSGHERHGQWERGFGGFGGRRGSGPWGGAAGPWGGWWPGPPPPFPPGPGRGGKASRGDVRAAILALLRDGPRNGYQIMSEVEERSGGAWRPSPGAVYPALSALADEGLIVAEEEPGGRRTYRLTEEGQRYVTENPDLARGAWESQGQQEAWQVPGLFALAARLGAGIVQVAHVGTPDQVRAAERLLERTRRELYQLLADEPEDQEEDDR